MPITPASGPSPVPQISGALQTVYSDIVHPLFFPPPSEFIQPLLDSFVESQDALLEDNTVFTASMRLREAAVECDGTIRELRRRDNAPKEAEAEAEHLSLDAVRKQRLRARLESQAGPRSESGLLHSREQILKKSQQMRADFEAQMKKEEEEVLKEFKEGLRKAVAL